MSSIVIIDYGMGNAGSVKNMIHRIGYVAEISSDRQVIKDADVLILPGVGHFAKAMSNLKKLMLIDLLKEKVCFQKTPILGICLGMQLFGLSSEEGDADGLGWLNARTVKFNSNNLLLPHVGWADINVLKHTDLFEKFYDELRFYFVHSYQFSVNDPEIIMSTTIYGKQFVSAVCHDNITGVQFHPEKSHQFGLKFFKNYLESALC